MEYAIFYNQKTRSYAMKQYSSITDKSSIIRTFISDTYINAVRRSWEIFDEISSLHKIPVVLIDSLDEPTFTSIYNKLHEFQRVVSSNIDIVNCPDLGNYDIICSDEGKNELLPLNRALTNNQRVYDIVAGSFIVAKCDDVGNTIGLTPEEVDYIHNYFLFPEVYTFRNEGDDITVVKISFELANVMRLNFISNISIIDK